MNLAYITRTKGHGNDCSDTVKIEVCYVASNGLPDLFGWADNLLVLGFSPGRNDVTNKCCDL